MMRAGLLTEVIDVLHPIEVKDGYGATETKWIPVIHTRARVVYKSGSREEINSELLHSADYEFTIRRYHPINEKMIIDYQGNKFRILSIDFTHKDYLTIQTELVND